MLSNARVENEKSTKFECADFIVSPLQNLSSNLHLMIGSEEGEVDPLSGDSEELLLTDEEDDPEVLPLCSIVPRVDWSSHSSKWVL